MPYLTAQEQEIRFKLYNQGLTDPEIGKIVFITPSAIYHWRKKNKLKANGIQKSKEKTNEKRKLRKEKAELLTKQRDEERMSLYNQGLNDVEIAHLLNYHKTTIFHWRKRIGLKSNKSHRKEYKND